ncbi:MAG: hypothetical protein AAF639_44695, partial [Chloroflexota bacterium]
MDWTTFFPIDILTDIATVNVVIIIILALAVAAAKFLPPNFIRVNTLWIFDSLITTRPSATAMLGLRTQPSSLRPIGDVAAVTIMIEPQFEAMQRIEECREKQLPKLDLGNLQLTYVPHEVFTLTHLHTLILGDFQPYIYDQYQFQFHIDLHKNQITVLPGSIAELQNLTHLDLRSNQLITLPESIAELQNLTHLDLCSNQLTALPNSIAELQNLT